MSQQALIGARSRLFLGAAALVLGSWTGCTPDPANTKTSKSAHEVGGKCIACEEANCGGPTINTNCTKGDRAAQCVDALQCARVSDCYRHDPSICYCGAHDIVACQNSAPGAGNGPAGPCVTEFHAAAGSKDPAAVLLALTDPSTPLGRAGFVMQCDDKFCIAECLPAVSKPAL